MLFTRTAALLTFLSSGAFAQTPCAWQAENDMLMVEVEAVAPAGDWVVETTFPGYAGEHYYRWNGPNHFSDPGHGRLVYEIEVHSAGRYELRIHNRHEHADSTLENDCWVRMDGGPWIKLYSNGSGSVGQWNWKSRFEIDGSHYDAGWDLAVGRHAFEISGRSTGFKIDRLNFYQGDPAGSQDVATPASLCKLGGSYCESVINSTGNAARIEALGSVSVGDNDLLLVARTVPSGALGLFMFSRSEADAPFGDGHRCVGGGIRRLPPLSARGESMIQRLNMNRPPADAIRAGSTWHFQAWFRDPWGGPAGFNLSNGLHVNFLP